MYEAIKALIVRAESLEQLSEAIRTIDIAHERKDITTLDACSLDAWVVRLECKFLEAARK